MARKIKKPRTVPAAGRGPAPAETAQQPERVEKCGHMDQPLLMLTMLLLGLGLVCLFSARAFLRRAVWW